MCNLQRERAREAKGAVCREGIKKACRGRMRAQQYTRERWPLLTIDIETVLVQGVGTQLGDTLGQLAQLPVQLLSVQPGACRVRTVVASCVHTGGCSISFRPMEVGTQRTR